MARYQDEGYDYDAEEEARRQAEEDERARREAEAAAQARQQQQQAQPPQPPNNQNFSLDEARRIAGQYGASIADNEQSDVQAVQQGRMSMDEFHARQQRRGAPNDPSDDWQNSSPSGGGGSVPSGGSPQAGGAPAGDPVTDAFRTAILDHLKKLQTPVDPNDPSIKASTGAYKLASQRSLEQGRNALAERAYAQGQLNLGGYDVLQQQARENAGARESQYAADTVRDAEEMRKAQLMEILGLGTSAGQFNRRLGFDEKALAQDDAHFAQRLGYDYAALNQQERQFIRQLNEQSRQFNDRIGYDYWSRQGEFNRDAIRDALTGA